MNRIFLIFIYLLFSAFAFAQRHEIGLQAGMSNLVGDIGRSSYIYPFPPTTVELNSSKMPFFAGLIYKRNFNPYQGIRLNLSYNYVVFDDLNAKENYKNKRGFYGSKSVYEASVLFEYNFFPINNEQKDVFVSPYIFGGVSALMYNSNGATVNFDFKRNAAGNAIMPTAANDFTYNISSGQKESRFAMAIPFGIGLKVKFHYNWTVFGELMFRPTNSDQLDGSIIDSNQIYAKYNNDIPAPDNPKKSLLQTEPYLTETQNILDNLIKNNEFGNPNTKDWMNTISIGITYAFGRPPCYCD